MQLSRRDRNIAPGTYTHKDGRTLCVGTGRAIYVLNSDRTSSRRGLHVRTTAGELVRVQDLRGV